MTAPAKIGQLYLVETRAMLADGTATVKATYIVNAPSVDDVASKLAYMLDLTIYKQFRVKSVTKIKEGFHIVYSSTRSIDDEPTHVEPNGITTHHTRTNQPPNRSQFALGIAGKVFGANANHALRKLGAYLLSLGTGTERRNPIMDGVVHCEEMGQGSLETMARDVSHWKQGGELRVRSTG